MVVVHVIILLIFIVMIIGKIIAISISKIRNRIAIKKNCNEKGKRDDDKGSNPHSKGDIFSRSWIVVFEINVHMIINIVAIVTLTIKDDIVFNITFS